MCIYQIVEQRGHRLEPPRPLRQTRQDLDHAGVHLAVSQKALAEMGPDNGETAFALELCLTRRTEQLDELLDVVRKGAGKKRADARRAGGPIRDCRDNFPKVKIIVCEAAHIAQMLLGQVSPVEW